MVRHQDVPTYPGAVCWTFLRKCDNCGMNTRMREYTFSIRCARGDKVDRVAYINSIEARQPR
jgi:hypothetical protein